MPSRLDRALGDTLLINGACVVIDGGYVRRNTGHGPVRPRFHRRDQRILGTQAHLLLGSLWLELLVYLVVNGVITVLLDQGMKRYEVKD